ncbi:hypothetical protein CBR_g25915 [Chara braunii]|uniref:DUF7869 domain-containing protein n=1 Tax=Chara braunii TaxID=69332 RepID=A0A388L6W8_CHABU|nr:hypothetical protein CBR_g25915 [Chara braunii]|eukprot:GBG77982.1 hypothetical protein CBR_g25915 [Chara braunii]
MLTRVTRFVEEHGDAMPNEMVVRGTSHRPKVRFPAYFTKLLVYESIKAHLEAVVQTVVSEQVFYSIWRKYLWHADLAKSNSFTKCGECVRLRQARDNAFLLPDHRDFDEKHRKHQLDQVAHRTDYADWKLRSILNPAKYLCLIVDGMDQKKTTIPHIGMHNYSKDHRHDMMMKRNLTEVVAHSRKPSIYIYTYLPFYAHGFDGTITCVMRTLCELQASRQKWPRHLRIKADNCWRENKNQYLMCLASLLVKFGIFEDVKVGFMLVGHTHTDIDAIFSVCSKKLKDNDAYTMKQLFSLIESSHKIPSKCIELDHIADWRRVVDRYVDRSIVGVSKPHLFKFFMHDGSSVVVYTKYCTDAEWMPEGRPVHWFPVVDGQYARPTSAPQPCVMPCVVKEDFRMARDSVQKFLDVLEQWQTYRKEEVDKREDALSYWKAIFVEADDMIQKQKMKETEEGEEEDVLGADEPEIYPHTFWPQTLEKLWRKFKKLTLLRQMLRLYM